MSTLAPRTKSCVELFLRCTDLVRHSSEHHDLTENQLADALGRFRIWAGNIGATQRAEIKSSLDSRLKNAPKVATQIHEVLDDLFESLNDAVEIITNVRDNRISVRSSASAADREEEISEIQEIFKSVNDGIGNLFRFSMLLRNNTNRDRYAKAITAGAACPFQDQFDIGHVFHKFPALAGKKWLIERLGKAITQRRQFLKYCREHRDKTSKDHDPVPSQIAGKKLLSVPAPPNEQHVSSRSNFSKPASTLAHTQASTLLLTAQQILEEDAIEDNQSQTSYATSIDEINNSSILHIVPIDDVSNGSGHFECVYCWQIQALKTQKAWKNHVLEDLRPYVCTFENCELKLFPDRHTWFSHELQDHRCEWQCNFCTRLPFKKSASYQSHLVNEHNLPFTEDQLSEIIKIGQRAITRVSPNDCPFCKDWDEKLRAVNQHIPLSEDLVVTPNQFQHHVGAHMEQLALFAIPRGHTETGDAGSGSAAASAPALNTVAEDEPSTPQKLMEDQKRCQDVLDTLLSDNRAATHFQELPDIPLFSMWLATNEHVDVTPLNLTTISQKLESGQYRTARDFQIDIYLMYAMHRILRTNERDFYNDSDVGELFRLHFTPFGPTPLGPQPFSRVVPQVEDKMRWLFYTARKFVKISPDFSDVQMVTTVLVNGDRYSNIFRHDWKIEYLYDYVECCDLVHHPMNLPAVSRPSAEYTNTYHFKLSADISLESTASIEKLDLNSSATIRDLFKGTQNPVLFVESLSENERPQFKINEMSSHGTVIENPPPRHVPTTDTIETYLPISEGSEKVQDEHRFSSGGYPSEEPINFELEPAIEERNPAPSSRVTTSKSDSAASDLLCAVNDNNEERVHEICDLLSDSAQIPESMEILHQAARQCNENIMEDLLDTHCFDIDSQDSRMQTPLHIAQSRGHDSIVSLLLERGARFEEYPNPSSQFVLARDIVKKEPNKLLSGENPLANLLHSAMKAKDSYFGGDTAGISATAVMATLLTDISDLQERLESMVAEIFTSLFTSEQAEQIEEVLTLCILFAEKHRNLAGFSAGGFELQSLSKEEVIEMSSLCVRLEEWTHLIDRQLAENPSTIGLINTEPRPALDTCSICLQLIESAQTAPLYAECSHKFHLNCLDNSLGGHCPSCFFEREPYSVERNVEQTLESSDIYSPRGKLETLRASSERNIAFHELFQQIPNNSYLLEDYPCTLEELGVDTKGRLYVSEFYLCFAAIKGTNLKSYLFVNLESVLFVEKRGHKSLSGYQIKVSALKAHLLIFKRFGDRELTYDHILFVWKTVVLNRQSGKGHTVLASTDAFGEMSTLFDPNEHNNCVQCRFLKSLVDIQASIKSPKNCSQHQCNWSTDSGDPCPQPKMLVDKDCGTHPVLVRASTFHTIYVSDIEFSAPIYVDLLSTLGLQPLKYANPTSTSVVDCGYLEQQPVQPIIPGIRRRNQPRATILFNIQSLPLPNSVPRLCHIVISVPNEQTVSDFKTAGIKSGQWRILPRLSQSLPLGVVVTTVADVDGNILEVRYDSELGTPLPTVLWWWTQTSPVESPSNLISVPSLNPVFDFYKDLFSSLGIVPTGGSANWTRHFGCLTLKEAPQANVYATTLFTLTVASVHSSKPRRKRLTLAHPERSAVRKFFDIGVRWEFKDDHDNICARITQRPEDGKDPADFAWVGDFEGNVIEVLHQPGLPSMPGAVLLEFCDLFPEVEGGDGTGEEWDIQDFHTYPGMMPPEVIDLTPLSQGSPMDSELEQVGKEIGENSLVRAEDMNPGIQHLPENFFQQDESQRLRRRRPFLSGWWKCGQCTITVNPSIFGNQCPDCLHWRCSNCCYTM